MTDDDIIEIPDTEPSWEPLEEAAPDDTLQRVQLSMAAAISRAPAAIPSKSGEPSALSEQMKQDNRQLFVLARSNDPSVMVPNMRKLVSNLYLSAKQMGDFSRNADLIYAIKTSQEAWYEYSENKEWGLATQLCETIIDRIGDLMYNPKWTSGGTNSFVPPARGK